MTRNEQILSEVQKRFSSNDTNLVSKISTFIDGARWADEHPKSEMVNKQEFIEKACEWLYNNFYEHPHEKNFICSENFATVEDMIAWFQIIMEE